MPWDDPDQYVKHSPVYFARNFKTPTLVITGEADVLIPPRNSEIIAERIPGARHRVIPDAGHAFFNQCPDEFMRVFVPFVESQPLN